MGSPEGTDSMRVGFCLNQRKTASFMRQKLISHAREHGVHFCQLDASKPLDDQGPFDVILHKVRGWEAEQSDAAPGASETAEDAWGRKLEDYMHRHPDVVVLDPPSAIRRLSNRSSMLDDLAPVVGAHGTARIPKQVVVRDGADAADTAALVAAAGLSLPVVAKPLVADGSDSSHAMALVTGEDRLRELSPPLVVQEFVQHGGVMFKVYVVGDFINVVQRNSLPDVDIDGDSSDEGMHYFDRISSYHHASGSGAGAAGGAGAGAGKRARVPVCDRLPPRAFVRFLARRLRDKLGLHLFNFDLIRDRAAAGSYYIIDINYFPGVAKMPGYEQVFTEFLLCIGLKRGCDVQSAPGDWFLASTSDSSEDDEGSTRTVCCRAVRPAAIKSA